MVQHVGLIHAHEANFSITCGLNDCKSTFTLYESYRRHVYRKHGEHVLPNNDDMDMDNNTDLNMENMDNDLHPEANVPPSMDTLLKNFKENLCSFILKCREKNHIPQAVQQEIVNDITFLFCYFKENYDAFITYHLQENGFNILECPELREVIQSTDFFEKASAAVRSPYMLKEHCKSKLMLVEPVHHILRSESGHKIGTYSYVPITEVLKHYSNYQSKLFNSRNIPPSKLIHMPYVFTSVKMNLRWSIP